MGAIFSRLGVCSLLVTVCSCQVLLGIQDAAELDESEGIGGDLLEGSQTEDDGGPSNGDNKPPQDGTGGDENTKDVDDDDDDTLGPSLGGSGNSAEDDKDKPDVVPPSVCDEYCENMDSFCTKDSEQFAGKDQCLKACELYDEGAAGKDGPTQACRLKYSSKGRYTGGLERDVLCRQAGPAGYGVCGSMCEGYCDVVMAACTRDVTSIYYYETYDECLSECEQVPVPDDVLYGSQSVEVYDGAHLQCRLFHALSALMLDAEEHCEHALGVTLCELPVGE